MFELGTRKYALSVVMFENLTACTSDIASIRAYDGTRSPTGGWTLITCSPCAINRQPTVGPFQLAFAQIVSMQRTPILQHLSRSRGGGGELI